MCERPGCSNPGEAAYGMVAEELLFWLAPLDAAAERAGVLCRRHADAMVVPRGWTLDDQRNGGPRLFQAERFANQQVVPTATRSRARSHGARSGEQLQIDGTGEIRRPALPPEPAPVAEELTVVHGAADARPTVVRRAEPATTTGLTPDAADEVAPLGPGDAAAGEVADQQTESAGAAPAAEPAIGAADAGEPGEVPSDGDGATEPPAEPAPDAPWIPHFDTDDDLNGMLDVRSPLLSRAFRGRDRR